MEAFVFAGTGYLCTSATPINIYPRYYIYNTDSTYSCTSIAGSIYHEAPSDTFYTIHWDPVDGYLTPTDSTAFLIADSTITFYGNYISANAPTAPTNLQSSTLSYAKVQLLWNDNANNETDYYLERKNNSESSFIQIAHLSSNATSYLDTGLTPQTEYTYRVRAYNSSGYSDYSNWAVSTTSTGFSQPPVAGFVCKATTVFSGMCVDFHDVSQYGESWEWIFANTYHFYVRETSYFAFNIDTGRYWNIKQVVTNNLGASTASMDLLIDANPSDIKTQSLNEGKLGYLVTWNDKCSFEKGFELYRQDNSSPMVLAAALPANSTTFTDFGADTTLGLDSTHQYGYFLRARSNDTVSNFIFSASYPIASFYAAPSTFYSSYGMMSVFLTNNCYNATTYRWIFGDGKESHAKEPLLHLYSSPTSALFYAILSCSNELGLWSSVTNTICFNLPPINLQAERFNSYNVTLQWNSQNARNDGYEIYRKTGTGSFDLCTTLPGTCTTFTDTGLVGANQYTYKARATTYQAVSDFTNEASVPVNSGIESWNLFSKAEPVEVMYSEAILPEKYLIGRKENSVLP
jgi:titin